MTEKNPVDHFLAWLIAMDDPEDEQGMRARQTVTLSFIIDRAREVQTWVELDRRVQVTVLPDVGAALAAADFQIQANRRAYDANRREEQQ